MTSGAENGGNRSRKGNERSEANLSTDCLSKTHATVVPVRFTIRAMPARFTIRATFRLARDDSGQRCAPHHNRSRGTAVQASVLTLGPWDRILLPPNVRTQCFDKACLNDHGSHKWSVNYIIRDYRYPAEGFRNHSHSLVYEPAY